MSVTHAERPDGDTRRETGPDRDGEFAAYMRARQPALLRTAYLLTGNVHDAEDLLQASLVRLYLAWGSVRSRDSVDAYVRRIMVNENNSRWRRAWKRREVPVGAVPDAASAETPREAGADVWALVCSLPTRQRAVVVLRYYEGLTEPEVARLTGTSVGTVKSQCHRALATLRSRATGDDTALAS